MQMLTSPTEILTGKMERDHRSNRLEETTRKSAEGMNTCPVISIASLVSAVKEQYMIHLTGDKVVPVHLTGGHQSDTCIETKNPSSKATPHV